MDVRKYILCLFTLFVFLFTGKTQENTVDTKKVLKEWLDKAFEFRYTQLDSSFHYGHKVLKAAQKVGLRDVEADALRSIATTFQAKGDYEPALAYAFQALGLSKELGDKLKIAHCYNIIGMVYDQQGNFPAALSHYRDAYDIYKALGQEEWLAMIATNLGILFKGQGEYKKVIPYYREAYAIYTKIGFPIEAVFCETNLGSVFYYTQQYDSCVYYSLKAEKALAKHNYTQIQAVAQGNAGLGYFGLGKIPEARQYLEKALAGHRKNDNKKEIAFTLIHLSKVYNKLKLHHQAFELLLEAKQLAQQIGSSKEVMDASELLAAYHKARQDYRQALSEYIDYSNVKDTLFNQEKMQAITNYQFQYDTEKKEQQIELLSRETAIQQLQLKQRTLLLIFVIGFLSIVAVTVYLWQNRRKIHSEAKLQRDAAKQVLQAEERERRRIATDLHDGVGQMLSAALLNLNQSLDEIPSGSEMRLSVEKAQTLLSESYDEMRSISHQMMPNALLKAGLASSIREFVEKINGPKIKVQLDVIGLNHRLDEQTETVLYRSIQEAVNNVVKHAEASQLILQLIKDEDGVTVTIEDNGKGFDMKKLGRATGIGLRNIYSRIALINGTVDIDSAIGKGTLFVIHIPKKELQG